MTCCQCFPPLFFLKHSSCGYMCVCLTRKHRNFKLCYVASARHESGQSHNDGDRDPARATNKSLAFSPAFLLLHVSLHHLRNLKYTKSMFLSFASKKAVRGSHVCESCDKTSRRCVYVERLSLAPKATAKKDMASRQPAVSGV